MASLLKKNSIRAPIDGEIVLMKDIPDFSFSQGMMGEGIAVKPNNGYIVSPCQGFISMIATTKHAIGITSHIGIEILIHIGINTINLKGEGFDVLFNKGDIVSIGTPLINIDSSLLSENREKFITSVFVCNSYLFYISKITERKVVEAGVHTLFQYQPKK